MKFRLSIIIITLIISGCAKTIMNKQQQVTTIPAGQPQLTYLALGDSYTIGESVPVTENFPNQLQKQLANIKEPAIIARTGWTTDELISAIEESGTQQHKYNIVTLLIGVNNQYRNGSTAVYRIQFKQLLNTAINYAGGNREHVFVLSIPDWGVAPFAQDRDRDKIANEIDTFNAINKQETEKAGITYINITPITKQAAKDASLIAADGLHPSAKMYGLWVNELLPAVKRQLSL
jgi:lysophospholipase L1-like esterase